MAARRFASLLPGATHWITALGHRRNLVGITHRPIISPRDARSLTPLTTDKQLANPKPLDHSAGALAKVEWGLSPYRVEVEALKAARPGYIVTRFDRGIYPGTAEDMRKALNEVLGYTPELLVQEAADLTTVYHELGQVADALAAGSKGTKLIDGMKATVKNIADRARNEGQPPKVLCLQSLKPFIVPGSWVAEMVQEAGATPLLNQPGAPARQVHWSQIIEAAPDKIIFMGKGRTIAQQAEDMDWLSRQDEFRTLRAFRSKQLFLVDGALHFHAAGPALQESMHILSEVLHPAIFGKQRLGSGWVEFF